MIPGFRRLIVVSVLVALATPVWAQDEPVAVFKSSVDLVSMAAIVRDGKGKIVSTLRREDFEVLDADGAPVVEDATGEVFLVPPSVGLSQTLLNADHHEVYYQDCPTGPQGETLRRHGDAIQRLPGGTFRARGRVDDTMNLGGIKVSSLEIEQVAQDHDAVREAAAVAVQPGGEGPEQLVLFVVPEGASDPSVLRAELGSAVARRLNPLFKVHDVVLVDALPRTPSHKLVRRELRARYGEGANRS